MNRRQGRTDWTDEARAEQLSRLANARQGCDLCLSTDDLTIPQVLDTVTAFLDQFA
jgi:hypothetical protein